MWTEVLCVGALAQNLCHVKGMRFSLRSRGVEITKSKISHATFEGVYFIPLSLRDNSDVEKFGLEGSAGGACQDVILIVALDETFKLTYGHQSLSLVSMRL